MISFLTYDFMRNAFIASAAAGVICGAIGYFLVLRREVFAGHAISHAAFPGATGAALIGLSPTLGLMIFALAAGLGLSGLGEKVQRDAAIGIVLSFSLGLGLLFLHFYTSSAGFATGLLFGNVLGISHRDAVMLCVTSFVCLLALGAIARPLIFASLQPDLAEAKGLRLDIVSNLFVVITALAIAEAIQIVGVLLVFALMVAPAAAAARLTHTVRDGVLLSAGAAVLVSWISLILAFYTDWPASFWITALGLGGYLAARATQAKMAR